MAVVAEERILVERLNLLLGNIRDALLPPILCSIITAWTLSNDTTRWALTVWCMAITVFALAQFGWVRHLLATGIAPERAVRTKRVLTFLHAIFGILWGLLPWLTLGAVSVPGSMLVVSVIAGIGGNALAMLSPVLSVFVVFVFLEVIGLTLALLAMGDPAYYALSAATFLFIISVVSMGRNSARVIGESIALRFENVELIGRLRVETDNAQQAQRTAFDANVAKSKFLAAASHDLRQPIHAQGLFMEVLARSELSATQREVLANARSTWQASAEMLDTLLDFSRIEAGVVEPQPRPFHLQKLLNKIENELAPQADAKGIVYRTRETHLAGQSDPVLIELILRNLVSNAIRYTEHGGVLLACRRRGDDVWLEVWDTGIGIEVQHRQAIFREFHQLGNSERDRRKGLGLGLAITDGLVRVLGHELSLMSTPGRGSVFRLRLPLANVPIIRDDFIPHSEPVAGELAVRVLVIDDDETVRIGMRHLLRDWGCECETAETIEEALVLARANPPQLLISDYRLREQRTGAEAIAALRAEIDARLPALLITGDTAPERLRAARASGVLLLHKPVSPAQLYQRMVSALASDTAPTSAAPPAPAPVSAAAY
jgi:signal transduction histidine kinase/ActR/RegA family two-component response regulator